MTLTIRADAYTKFRPEYNTAAALLADTSLSYTAGTSKFLIEANDVITAEGFRYKVAASAASDHHLTTAGGVKLYVIPIMGRYPVDAWSTNKDGATDDSAAVLAAVAAGPARLGIGTYYMAATLAMDDDQGLEGVHPSSSILKFADGLNGVTRANTDIDGLRIKNFGITRGTNTTEQIALDLDNAIDCIAENIEIANFSRAIANKRTATGAYCWRNTFRNINVFTCKEGYYAPHVTSGTTYRSNENRIVDCYFGDVGRWSEHVALTIGGIGNIFDRCKFAQSGTNTTGAAIYFGEFSSENILVGCYHEGSYPYLWQSAITTSSRLNTISGHHVDTGVSPTIDDPNNSVSYDQISEGAKQYQAWQFGPDQRAFDATAGTGGVKPAAVHAFGDATVPAFLGQSRDGQPLTAMYMGTANDDTGGPKVSGFGIEGYGLVTTNAGELVTIMGGTPAIGGGAVMGGTDPVAGTKRIRFKLNGDVLPEATGTQDLGSSAKEWAEIHADGFYSGGNQVVGAQQAAIADATDAASTQARLNDLLAALRTHGLIAT